MEGSAAEFCGGSGQRAAKRKSSRSNSIIFKTVPENARFIDSSEDDSSADGSLALDELDDTQHTPPQQPARNLSSAATPRQQQRASESTQKQATVFSAVRKFAYHMSSSLGFQSASGEEASSNTNRRTSYGGNHPNSANTTTYRRSSVLSARTASASVMSQEQQPTETYCLSDGKINVLRSLINHPVWSYTSGFFVFVMLFGAPIQDLFLPPSADIAVDVIFTLAFVMLLVDILILCIVDKAYFAWNRVGTSLTPRKSFKWCNIHAGSFMFWCDVVGTLTFIYDLSYINTGIRANPLEVGLEVTARWAANYTVSIVSPHFRWNWEILIVIGRTARLARPIRSHVLVEGMHYYVTRNEKLMYLDPSFWLQKLASLQNYRRKSNRNETNLAHASERVLVGSAVSNSGNMFSLGDSKMISSKRSSNSMVRVTEEQGSQLSAEKKKRCFCFPCKENLIPREIRRKSSNVDSEAENGTEMRRHYNYGSSKDSRSHVGATMQQLTGQRVALGVFVAFLLNVLCTWQSIDTTPFMAMTVLHGQTSNSKFAKQAVDTARESIIPNLYYYERDGVDLFNETDSVTANLRGRERLYVTVINSTDLGVIKSITKGHFNIKKYMKERAIVEIMTTLFIILVWLLGIVLFVGPVMILVVEPIERMVRLLNMLMKDPLGYTNTKEYRDFMEEDEYFAEHSAWGKDVLSGMETTFLMNTLLRIGSLMKVGFGSAGVEIIRNNLERGRKKDVLELSKQGTTVSCIFLFCDIRQFTDATECLQEEVFVFTNKIAAVVHSICNSYGGTANKNIGDAFLVSWLLDDDAEEERKEEEQDMFEISTGHVMFSTDSDNLIARNNQADKALLSVVKISIALHYDYFFVETMNEEARNKLLTKLSKRKGPIVQMGFGLHAGKAVQGAIGSPRKLDATYISESVERAEFLESSTKTYGVPLLMSETFFSLLDSANKYRCRKLDQLILLSAENDSLVDPREILDSGEKMSIYTFDMDIDALWKVPPTNEDDGNSTTSNSDVDTRKSFKQSLKRRSSIRRITLSQGSNDFGASTAQKTKSRRFSSSAASTFRDVEHILDDVETPEARKKVLILPSGVSKYSDKSWLEPDMKAIRQDLVTKGVLFPKFDDGLKSYIAKDWEHAKKCFETVLSQRDDGPSRYFLKCIEKHGGKPPRDFVGYRVV